MQCLHLRMLQALLRMRYPGTELMSPNNCPQNVAVIFGQLPSHFLIITLWLDVISRFSRFSKFKTPLFSISSSTQGSLLSLSSPQVRSFFSLGFSFPLLRLPPMATRTSQTSSSGAAEMDDFKEQSLLSNPQDESCIFTDREVENIKRLFPTGAIFKPFDQNLHSDAISETWVCFPAFPFQIGFSFPFPPLTTRFFEKTGLSFIQTMPMVWRTLITLERLIDLYNLDLDVADLALIYDLRSHGSSRYLLKHKLDHEPLILKCSQSNVLWKKQFFFVKRSSIPDGGSLPYRWITKCRKFLYH